jgi:hypothetical protein
MPGKEIKGRSKIATYRHGGRAKFLLGGVSGTRIKSAIKNLGETMKKRKAIQEAKKIQAAKDEIRKSEMGYKKGGRAK